MLIHFAQLTSKTVRFFLRLKQSQPNFTYTFKVEGNKNSTFNLINLQTFGYLRYDVILATTHLE